MLVTGRELIAGTRGRAAVYETEDGSMTWHMKYATAQGLQSVQLCPDRSGDLAFPSC
jgi:hypothetical protein